MLNTLKTTKLAPINLNRFIDVGNRFTRKKEQE